MIFPLKFTPFEEYMLADDRDSHPMTFFIRMVFSGELDQGAFRRGMVTALDRHPLLRARLSQNPRGKNYWVDAPSGDFFLDVAALGVPLKFPGQERIHLQETSGLRIWLRVGSGEVEARFQFHHSCCDGIGAYRFIEDLLVAYHRELQGEPAAEFRPLDEIRLQSRFTFGLNWWRFLLRLPLELYGLFLGSVVFFLRRPAVTASPKIPSPGEYAGERLLDLAAHTFTPVESRGMRDFCKRIGVTVNDFFLEELLFAFDEWNLRHAERSRHSMIRIMVPFNLRLPADDLMPAANVVAMVNVDRHMRYPWWRRPRTQLKYTHFEMNLMKLGRFPLTFCRVLSIVSKIPGCMQLLVSGSRCFATTALSNMGKIFVEAKLPRREGKLMAGNLRLERVESAPPVRSKSVTSFTTLLYDDQITIVMNYDRTHFLAEDARRLLKSITDRISRTISPDASGGETSPERAAASV